MKSTSFGVVALAVIALAACNKSNNAESTPADTAAATAPAPAPATTDTGAAMMSPGTTSGAMTSPADTTGAMGGAAATDTGKSAKSTKKHKK